MSSRAPGVIALSALTALVVVGLAGILTIGIFLLAFAGVAGVIVIRRLAPIPGDAWIGAVAVGVALPVLGLLAIQEPIVSCSDGGARATNLWMNSSDASGSRHTVDFVYGSSGTFSIGDKRFAYGCKGDDLEYLAPVS